jgi:hypothetical protein
MIAGLGEAHGNAGRTQARRDPAVDVAGYSRLMGRTRKGGPHASPPGLPVVLAAVQPIADHRLFPLGHFGRL